MLRNRSLSDWGVPIQPSGAWVFRSGLDVKIALDEFEGIGQAGFSTLRPATLSPYFRNCLFSKGFALLA